ncbi:MAG TPA: hypothetical protein PKA28_16055 [Methylomusa anaerophila]|nr:hypothetical protein [Methylomusa anaerophila]
MPDRENERESGDGSSTHINMSIRALKLMPPVNLRTVLLSQIVITRLD